MIRRYLLLPSLVKILLISNGFLFFIEIYATAPIINNLALWPLHSSQSMPLPESAPSFQIWQLVTYGFLHGSITHLLLNMYALWLFGSRLENLWGSRPFALYYFVCVIGAGLTQTLVTSLQAETGQAYPTVGASGGVFGLLLAYGLAFPRERLMLLFPPVILQAKWLVIIYGAIELLAGVTGTQAGVAHFAHLGGMLFGFLLLVFSRHHTSPRN